jgi:MFS family permease
MRALRNRLLPGPRGDRSHEHRAVVLIRVLLGFEAVLYSAVAPVLPHYQHTLSASKPAIGVLAAAYPAGMIPGSLLGGWLAARAGVRRTTVVGLLIFAVSIIPFGFASDIVSLDVLRFVQGAACGCIWAGGLTWVIAIAPRERRGEVLGSVIAAAIFGTLLGPVVGTLAVAVGTEIVFMLVGAVSLALCVWTLEHREPPQPEAGAHAPWRALLRSPRMLLGLWLVLLEAGTIGATGTLLPLRLNRFGASGVAIGATFLVTSLLSTFATPVVGRIVDRRGARTPVCLGLGLTGALIAALAVPQSWPALAILSVLAIGGPLTAIMIPATEVITDTAEKLGVALAFATMMLNLGWAFGETIGAPAAAGLSQATSDTVPFVATGLLMVLTVPLVMRARLPRGRRPEAAPVPGHPAPAAEASAALDSASIVG